METVYTAKSVIRRQSDGKYLLLQTGDWPERPDRSHQPDLPGGVVESGEAPDAGCLREIYEETGISSDVVDLRLVYAQTHLNALTKASIIRLFYYAEVGDVSVKLSWEHEKFSWVTKDELLALDMRQPYPQMFVYLEKVGVLI